ncbi:MAG: hypothetical protein M1832_003417 [Thelocarpon impressellum]|nr:MAG: hypothetical protein M1832_003417 [Thelocarpon impressellum]
MDMDHSVHGVSMTPEAQDHMSPSTPSPTTSVPAGGSSSRRPPRKSTLTQQQKNQKRQRATQDQLATLEVEFNQNPTPTAVVRERIAQDINMTERSVQIWFQNRRAKIKLLAKKSIETGEDCDAIPESMRHYLALQAMESGKPLGRGFPGRSGPLDPYGNAGLLMNAEQNNPSKVVIHHFACRSLSIGSWRRVGQNAMDLVIFYSPDKACITYYINNDSAGYKIEYPFAYIRNVSLEAGDGNAGGPAGGQKPGGLLIELSRPPNFFMDSSGSGGFYQCGDFTEEQQASRIMVHHLGGHPKVLSGQLQKLVSLDSFQTRHHPVADQPTLSVSAPVSPGPHRPASQPNHVTHPHVGMFQERQYGVNLHPARGHKRQRSRSVPIAVDFGMLHNPVPAFGFHQDPAPPAHMHNADIYAPAPLHQPAFGPLGNNLRIDTTSDYGMDFRPYPVSAGTTASPSEYASPAFFASGPQSDAGAAMPTAGFQTSYSLPFLTPMPDAGGAPGGPAGSPLSAMSHHGDPVIANQSPPLSGMHRSTSTDFLQMSHDAAAAAMSDDGLALSELYSKQSLNLPMHSPGPGLDGPSDDLAMQSMVSFDTIDPSSLSPENGGL